jgi:hypothetical protein
MTKESDLVLFTSVAHPEVIAGQVVDRLPLVIKGNYVKVHQFQLWLGQSVCGQSGSRNYQANSNAEYPIRLLPRSGTQINVAPLFPNSRLSAIAEAARRLSPRRAGS